MKTNLTAILGGVACGLALGLASASASTFPATFTSSPGTTVPDGNAAGITSTINVNGLGTGSLGTDLRIVNLTFNISGGNNGDLYAYLSYGGQRVTLLDRPGLVGDSAGLGYTTSGFNNVHLSDGAYGNINTTPIPTTGGTYNPAGGSVTFTAFNGISPNGNWVLFISDLSGPDTSFSRLDSWSLTFAEVPEPINVALLVFAAALGGAKLFSLRRDLAARLGFGPSRPCPEKSSRTAGR